MDWNQSYPYFQSIGELKIAEDEAFPDTMGKMASHYMKEEILRLTSDGKLSVCDVNGSLIFFAAV